MHNNKVEDYICKPNRALVLYTTKKEKLVLYSIV